MTTTPLYCPSWEYSEIEGHQSVLSARNHVLLSSVRQANRDRKISVCVDTRVAHGSFFSSLTPAGCHYYAGNYRGSAFPCLLYRDVFIASDPRVGHPPGAIALEMGVFERLVGSVVSNIDQVRSASRYLITDEEKLYRTVELVAGLFVYFLEIHPYMNGNGHMARLMLIALLGVYGIYLSKWKIDPRPQDPPYSGAIKAYRDGNQAPLVRFILSCI